MSPRLFLAQLVRESRGSRGRLAFFVVCLGVGVAAVVSVAGLSAALDDGIRSRARELLAGDLAVTSRRPPVPEIETAIDTALDAVGARDRARIRELVTVVAAPAAEDGEVGASRLVELKAVGRGYPFYGRLETDPARPLDELLTAETAVAAPELLAALGLAGGDLLRVGGEDFRITATVVSEPDRIGVGLTLGPRLFLSLAGLERTGLVQKGSRVDYKVLAALPAGGDDDQLRSAAERLRRELPGGYRVETWRQAQPALRRGIERVDRFLGLVALLSLLVGGVGVAQTVRAWIAGRLDAVAALKCLGFTPRQVLALYLGQTGVLALAGTVAGALAGVGVQALLPRLFPDLVPVELLSPWQPAALGRGLALGLGAALLFSLPPLLAVLRVPPVRVLRRNAEPPPTPWSWNVGLTAALALGVFGMAALQSRSWLHGAQFTGALAVTTALLALAAAGLTRIAAKVPRGSGSRGGGGGGRDGIRWGGLGWRFAVAALARPGAGTAGAVVALGIGVLVVVSMALVERQLGDELSADLPDDAPTVFLVDVQPDQWPGVRAEIERAGAARLDSVPVVMARLSAVDGRGAGDLAEARREDGGARWALTREQRLTYLDRLPDDNRIVAGELWGDPERLEVSVEEEFAADLGVGLGSRLSFDVQGVPLELWVTSIRSVDWETFGINFFLVVEPEALAGAPHFRVAAARLPAVAEQGLQDRIAAGYPNVTLLRLREILDKIVAILRRIGLAVRLLGSFTVLAGGAILAGGVAASSLRRGREAALLKTLGLPRAGVAALFAAEYAAIGLVAGALGVAGGAGIAHLVLTRWFEIDSSLRPGLLAAGVGGAAAVAVVAGLAASARALSRRPIATLRDGVL